MSETYTSLSGFTLESAQQFPNLLEDKDFAYYYWTLPFCTL